MFFEGFEEELSNVQENMLLWGLLSKVFEDLLVSKSVSMFRSALEISKKSRELFKLKWSFRKQYERVFQNMFLWGLNFEEEGKVLEDRSKMSWFQRVFLCFETFFDFEVFITNYMKFWEFLMSKSVSNMLWKAIWDRWFFKVFISRAIYRE